MSTTLSIAEAQGKLSQLLELAQAGHEVIIQDAHKGKAIVRRHQITRTG